MKYLESFKFFEKRNKILPFRKIFNILPRTVDIRIIEWMIENWGPIFKKSPYGTSYYNDEKTWDITIDGSLRLSDHWNFYSKATGNKIHSKIDNKPNTQNNTEWTIARYDASSKTYIEEISYPFNNTKENAEQSISLIRDLIKPSETEIMKMKMNQNLNILKSYVKKNDLYVSVTYYKNNELFGEYHGKVLRIKAKKLALEQNGERITFNSARFEHSMMEFYDSNEKFILKKKKNDILN